MSRWHSFLYRPSSALVEPKIAGVVGAALVLYVRLLLPYALAFAAGAMIFVVVEELIPESQQGRHTEYRHAWHHDWFCHHDVTGRSLGLSPHEPPLCRQPRDQETIHGNNSRSETVFGILDRSTTVLRSMPPWAQGYRDRCETG